VTSTPSTSNALTIVVPDGELWFDTIREFDAPVAAVFDAHRDPEKIRQWLGPDGYDMNIERYDFTSGGGYRYIHRSPSGEEYAFNGVFHVVRENELAIQTFEWEGVPDVVSIEALKFEDLGGDRTRITIHSVYPNQEARDGMTQSGMEEGMSQGYAKLDALLAGGSEA
jgi:uncharacterized protein YndB with AHSA1/START domain